MLLLPRIMHGVRVASQLRVANSCCRLAHASSRRGNERRLAACRCFSLGLHHYALELRSRSDVDELAAFLRANEVDIVDRAGEYYKDYCIFCLPQACPTGTHRRSSDHNESSQRLTS
jgi:hypothetical protein